MVMLSSFKVNNLAITPTHFALALATGRWRTSRGAPYVNLEEITATEHTASVRWDFLQNT